MQDRQQVAMRTRTENFHSIEKSLEFGEQPGVDNLEIKAEVESSGNHVTWLFKLGSCQW
jgi:hypothetical protein